MTDRISGSAFKQMVLFGAACITLEREAINDLNVFPVPDGDTGTNKSLTIQTAANELKKNQPVTVSDAASITASALLRGARGNSGVILSLLFRGVSKYLKGDEDADGVQLAGALKEGVATAYSAVMKPAEGTVLTVSRLAADRAAEAAEECNSVEYVLQEAIRKGLETLDETIEMNPVLKKAGVVDAGGKGYLVILDGMLRALRGEEIPDVSEERPRARPISPPSARRRSPSPSTRCSLCANGKIPPLSPCGLISAPSAIAWSSARTTMRSRSMYTRTSPVRP